MEVITKIQRQLDFELGKFPQAATGSGNIDCRGIQLSKDCKELS